MATIRNPINQDTFIDLAPALEEIKPQFGRIADSGLFEEQGITANVSMYRIIEQGDTKMTKLTSRVERDAMATEKSPEKIVTMGSISLKITGGVHVEDLIGVSGGVFNEASPTFQMETIKELTRMANVGAANREYLLATATQGKVRDPWNSAVKIDNYANTGTARTEFLLNASPNASIFESLNALANQVSQLNGYNGNVGTIEVVLGEQAFTDIVSHPDFTALYQLAFTGMGNAAVNQPFLNGTVAQPTLNQYGYRREFRWNNFLFVTYPQKFKRWDGTLVDIIEPNKGWTIVNVSGLYRVKYCPAPYVTTYDQAGTRWVARSTGIINDTHADFTLESHMIPYMARPEMSLDITVSTTEL